MPSQRTMAKMKLARRDLWFLVMMGFFIANTLVMMLCHHLAEDHTHETSATKDLLSFVRGAAGSTNGGTNSNQEDLPIFAICLLTRDDLPIIPEWIAYHYHAVNLRHLVMAIDPGSETDPQPVLDNFRKHLGNTLVIDEWKEADFMPDYFVQGDFGKAPHFIGKGAESDNLTWEEWYSQQENFGPRKIRDQTLVNSHRYRQTRFLSRCSEHLKQTYQTSSSQKQPAVWMSTLDSDEFLAVNPWVMAQDPPSDDSILRLEKGAVLRWLVDSKSKKASSKATPQQQPRDEHADEDATQTSTQENESPPDNNNDDPQNSDICFQIPRLLFGAVELSPNTTSAEILDADVTYGLVQNEHTNKIELVNNLPRHSNPMETLRWKFHAAPNDERNFQQKVILDLFRVPPDDELWGDHVHTVHRPSRKLCAPESNTNLDGAKLVPHLNETIRASPVVGFHYIGSEDRYFSRPNDFRRSPRRYRERSNITHSRDETGWIDQWFERFVNDVGVDTAAALLPNYVVAEKNITK